MRTIWRRAGYTGVPGAGDTANGTAYDNSPRTGQQPHRKPEFRSWRREPMARVTPVTTLGYILAGD